MTHSLTQPLDRTEGSNPAGPVAHQRVLRSTYEAVALQFLTGPINLGPLGVAATVREPNALGWPLLLNREELCRYLGMSWSTISKVCPIAPVELGANVARYSRTQIDDWVSSCPARRTKLGVAANPTTAEDSVDDAHKRRVAAIDRALARTKTK